MLPFHAPHSRSPIFSSSPLLSLIFFASIVSSLSSAPSCSIFALIFPTIYQLLPPTFKIPCEMQNQSAFVSTPLLFHARPALPSRDARPIPSHSGRRVTPARLVMQESAAPAGKEKKKAPVNFALDMKGNFVWNLRSASPEDILEISEIVGPKLPSSIITSLVEDSPCSTICDASVKGRKEGEGYRNVVMGCALVDVGIVLRKSNVVKRGDFITVALHPEIPDGDIVRKKLVMGSLRKMKDAGVIEVTSVVAEENTKRIELLKSCMFEEESNTEGRVNLLCNLASKNPNPEKKMI